VTPLAPSPTYDHVAVALESERHAVNFTTWCGG
jgi:hypothetical protein